MIISVGKTNPQIDQDRVFDLVDHFDKFSHPMFHQQQKIYTHLAKEVKGQVVLEAGCGNGIGTAILERTAYTILGTDKIQRNVDFAKALYPWILFRTWDIHQPTSLRGSIVVCVETIEHVADPRLAIQNLIGAATEEVWIATPNGRRKPRPPENPYHVCEYTTGEVLDMIGDFPVTIREGITWKVNYLDTEADPLVYQVKVR